MLEGRGRYWKTNNKFYIYIPMEVAIDSAFPLKHEKGDVNVKIQEGKIVISPRKI